MTKVTTNNVVPITENPPTNDLKYQLHRKKRSQIDLDKHEAFNVQYACYSVEYESNKKYSSIEIKSGESKDNNNLKLCSTL